MNFLFAVCLTISNTDFLSFSMRICILLLLFGAQLALGQVVSKTDSLFIHKQLWLQKDISSQLKMVEEHTDKSIHHEHELWEHYLSQPHPSVSTVNLFLQQAANEFLVPVEILRAIAYTENNYTHIGPSIDYGWGMMHLVQNNYCNALGEAAKLLHLSEQTLKDDPRQNIRAAAALLRKYQTGGKSVAMLLSGKPATKTIAKTTRVEDWYPAVKKYAGLISDELCDVQAKRYYAVINEGAKSTTLWEEDVLLPSSKKIDFAYIKQKYTIKKSASSGSRTADYGPAVGSFTSCNFTTGRNHSIDTYVNHWIGTGTAAGAVSWFQNCSAQASAHFVINNSGTIYQTVAVANTAWHCGASGYPYNNGRSIGVEHEATVANPSLWNSTAMLQASAQMACYFCSQYSIPTNQNITSPGICGHNSMPGTNTSCPGTIPWSTWFGYFNTGNCNAQPPAQPANDYCGNPPALAVYGTNCGATVSGDVGGATQSAAPTLCDGFTSANALDVWYKFTATAIQHTITVVPSSGLDAVVEVRTGCPGTSVDCQDAGGGEGATEVLQVSGLTAGTTYYVRVYDYSGSGIAPTTTTFTICVTTPCTLPTKPIVNGNNTICSGQSSILSVSNPCSGCTYSWSNGITGNTITVTTAGAYRVTATNTCGTSASDPFTLTVISTPQPSISNLSNSYCLAASAATLSLSPSGGTLSGNGISGNVFSPSSAGVGSHSITYSVTQNGCTGTATQNTTVTANPSVQITANGPLQFCLGGNVELTATQGSAYLWSNGASSPSITVNQTGVFTVTVTNAGGCAGNVASAPLNVTAYPLPIANAGIDYTFLYSNGDSATLGGNPTALSGTPPYSYAWSPSNGLNDANTANPTAKNISATVVYVLTVTDANGCNATDYATVYVTYPCQYHVPQNTFYFSSAGGIDSFYVDADGLNCPDWDVQLCNWIQIISPTLPFNGDAKVIFQVQNNPLNTSRNCTIQITGGNIIAVYQQGATPVDPCNPPLATPLVQQNFCELATPFLPGISYQWYINGSLINGATTRFYTVNQSGYYTVLIADSNFCTAQSADLFVSHPACMPVGIAALATGGSFQFFENENGDWVLESNEKLDGSHLVLYDITGREIQKNQLLQTTVIPTQHLPAGVYVVTNSIRLFKSFRIIKR